METASEKRLVPVRLSWRTKFSKMSTKTIETKNKMATANPTVNDTFAGCSVFVTGATGFIGKVLVEKLLRSCPKIDKIYLLLRGKKGDNVQERLKKITALPLYDLLKKEHPTFIDEKIRIIEGDVTELGLGISEQDRRTLIENVSVIFHGAASVRFDDPLTNAILMNTRGTREVVLLAKQMKRLKVIAHVSTTYCNTDKFVVEEKLYPPHADWKKSIELAENLDRFTMDILTAKYMSPLPNTYTFSKSLAEHVVYDLCQNEIPAVVFRPSIVISSMNDPIPGWIDNFNGPVGVLVASGKGIMRTFYASNEIRADYMPVDKAVRALIISAWDKALAKDPKDKLDVKYYNCSSHDIRSITIGQMLNMGKQFRWEIPLRDTLWYPEGDVTNCIYWYYINMLLLQLLPAVIIDSILKLAGKKPLLTKIQRRIYVANMALSPFIRYQWKFLNKKLLNLEKQLNPDDLSDFGFDTDNVNVYNYFKNSLIGGRQYLLGEDLSTLEHDKRHLYRLYLLDMVVRVLFYCYVFWLVFFKINILAIILGAINNFYDSAFNVDFN